MKSYKVLILLVFIVANSCSKEDEINQTRNYALNITKKFLNEDLKL